MNRKLMSVMLVALVVVACGPMFVTSAWGDSTTALASVTNIPNPYSGSPYDITAAGALDWAVTGVNEKAGGTAITTFGYGNTGYSWQTNFGDPSYPQFAFTDGDSTYGATSASGAAALYRAPYGGADIALPAGDFTITAWMGASGKADFGAGAANESITTTIPAAGREMFVYHYHSTVAQTFSLSSSGDAYGTGVPTGLFAVAVSVVAPEPSTLALLVTGLFGLLAYAWRKRR